MKLVTFVNESGPARAGVWDGGERVIDLHATDASLPLSMRELLAAGPLALQKAAQAANSATAVLAGKPRLLAPIPDPLKVICVGLNYRDHAAESNSPIPRDPVIFSKFSSAIVGPGAEIRLPRVSDQVDYEAELVVVIGQTGKNVPEAKALELVAGYTVGHDVSARDWQLNKDGKQWLLGKTFDTFAPTGPALVTKDEVGDPHSLRVSLRLNGQVMQDTNTSQFIFNIPKLIAYVSQVVTLAPGDVIFTGTGPGVGAARKPPVFLKPGDVCEVEIEKLGVLRNPVVAD